MLISNYSMISACVDNECCFFLAKNGLMTESVIKWISHRSVKYYAKVRLTFHLSGAMINRRGRIGQKGW